MADAGTKSRDDKTSDRKTSNDKASDQSKDVKGSETHKDKLDDALNKGLEESFSRVQRYCAKILLPLPLSPEIRILISFP